MIDESDVEELRESARYDQVFNRFEAAAFLKISYKTLCNWEAKGIGPTPHRPLPGNKKWIRYTQSELIRWIREGTPGKPERGQRAQAQFKEKQKNTPAA